MVSLIVLFSLFIIAFFSAKSFWFRFVVIVIVAIFCVETLARFVQYYYLCGSYVSDVVEEIYRVNNCSEDVCNKVYAGKYDVYRDVSFEHRHLIFEYRLANYKTYFEEVSLFYGARASVRMSLMPFLLNKALQPIYGSVFTKSCYSK